MRIPEATVTLVRQHAKFLECLAPEFTQGKTKRCEFIADGDSFVARVYFGEMMVDEWMPELL